MERFNQYVNETLCSEKGLEKDWVLNYLEVCDNNIRQFWHRRAAQSKIMNWESRGVLKSSKWTDLFLLFYSIIVTVGVCLLNLKKHNV